MMDINMLNLMSLGAMGMEMPEGVQSPEMMPQGQGFVDLLDLASSLEIAESQTGDSEVWMESELSSLPFEGQSSFQSAALNSQMLAALSPMANPLVDNLPMNLRSPTLDSKAMPIMPDLNPMVGQLHADVSAEVETGLSSEWAMDRLQLGMAKPGAPLASKGPTREAVMQWGHAIASGELKSVEVEAQEPVVLKAEVPVQDALGLKKHVEKDMQSAPELLDRGVSKNLKPESERPVVAVRSQPRERIESSESVLSARQDQPVTEKAMPHAIARSAQSREGDLPRFERTSVESLPKVERSEARVVVEAPRAPMSQEPKLEAKNENSGRTQSAREFFMEDPSSYAMGTQKLERSEPTVVSRPMELGDRMDHRVPDQTLDFVADKIDALKSQGGGLLRLRLDPVQMGGLSIKVSQRLGQTQIEIQADRPETAQLLRSSGQDLLNRIESQASGPARLDIQLSNQGAQSNLVAGQRMSTVDMLGLELPDVQNLDLRADSNRGVQAASSSQEMGKGSSEGWSRDERREFAREQWTFSRKRSA